MLMGASVRIYRDKMKICEELFDERASYVPMGINPV